MPNRARKIFAGVVALACLPFAQARAAVTFDLRTGPTTSQSLIIDSNKCPTEGPIAAYVAGVITNTGAAVTNVTATISGLGGGFALTGTQSATLSLGALDAGASAVAGWHITYPCTAGAVRNITIATSSSGGSDSDSIALTVKSSQSAAAGGDVITSVLGPGAVVGQIISADVAYDFGNIDTGNEFILQPAGNTTFDAACLRLVRTEVTASNITAIAVGTVNRLYFVSPVKQPGNGYTATVRYSFRYRCAGVTTTARPYAGQTSGSTNVKYTGNYDGTGSISVNFPTPTNPFTIAKAASATYLPLGSGAHAVTYTVTVSNPSAYATYIDRFTDTLPSGVTYSALGSGSVTSANSSSLPTAGAAGALTFSGFNGSSYLLPASSSITLVYSVSVQDVAGSYANLASAHIGAETIGPASATVTVTAPELTVAKSVDAYDPGAAGVYMVPGEDVVYTISVENTGVFAVTADSLQIVDIMPAELAFYNGDFDPGSPGMGPFSFAGGATGVTCCASGDREYSSSASAPPTYGYAPASGYDDDVNFIRLTPKGVLDPGESIEISFRARIN